MTHAQPLLVRLAGVIADDWLARTGPAEGSPRTARRGNVP
jgi:hypothetical protein